MTDKEFRKVYNHFTVMIWKKNNVPLDGHLPDNCFLEIFVILKNGLRFDNIRLFDSSEKSEITYSQSLVTLIRESGTLMFSVDDILVVGTDYYRDL